MRDLNDLLKGLIRGDRSFEEASRGLDRFLAENPRGKHGLIDYTYALPMLLPVSSIFLTLMVPWLHKSKVKHRPPGALSGH